MARQFWWIPLFAVAFACGEVQPASDASHETPGGETPADARAIDAPSVDAVAVDASPPDTGASIDASPTCEGGPCCEGSAYRPSTYVCDTGTERRCGGTSCGADVEMRSWSQTCTGTSGACDGPVAYEPWTVSADCGADQLCNDSGATPTCTTCPYGCASGKCLQCGGGLCCDNSGSFKPTSAACNSWKEYRCSGTACGADAQERLVQRFCPGNASTCSGTISNPAWTTTSNCTTSQTCATDQSTYATCESCDHGCSNGQCDLPPAIYLFPTTSTYKPNFGGRAGADQICSAEYNKNYKALGCSNVRAFISVSATDEIRDMPANYKVPTNLPILLADGTAIDKNWAALLDGSIANPLSSLVGGSWASGSKENGEVLQTCKGWTVADNSDGATYGNHTTTDKTWMWQGGWACNFVDWRLLCACW